MRVAQSGVRRGQDHRHDGPAAARDRCRRPAPVGDVPAVGPPSAGPEPAGPAPNWQPPAGARTPASGRPGTGPSATETSLSDAEGGWARARDAGNQVASGTHAAVTATAATSHVPHAGPAITSATPLTSPGNSAREREPTRGGGSMQ